MGRTSKPFKFDWQTCPEGVDEKSGRRLGSLGFIDVSLTSLTYDKISEIIFVVG